MNEINENLYIISTVLFVVITAVFFFISWLMQRKTAKRVFRTRNITLVAILCGLSVVLTNVLGYSFVVGGGVLRLSLGNFVIFIVGMLFGPLMGMTSGIVSDTVGSLINIGGIYHFGYTSAKALFGFAGALVFVWKNNKWLIAKITLIFTTYFLIYSFVISPICLVSLYDSMAIAGMYSVAKVIRTPIELAIYIPLTIVGFELLCQLMQRNISKKDFIWAFKYGFIHFRKKKSLSEKYKIKENNNENELSNANIKIKDKKEIEL